MGTRSMTIVLDEDGNRICALYKQYDGYIEGGWGNDLKKFLTGRVVGNGIPGDRTDDTKFSNGMSGLAVQLIANFCSPAPGGFYLYPPQDATTNVSYIYEIYPAGEIKGFSGTTTLNLRVHGYNMGSLIYDGPAENLRDTSEDEEEDLGYL